MMQTPGTASDVAHPYVRMAQNNAWANATLYAAVHTLPDGAPNAAAPGFFPTLIETLNHIYEVDLYYVDALEGEGLGRQVYQREAEHDTIELAARQAAVDRRLIDFSKALTPAELGQSRRTERADGLYEETVSALLLHLFQHQVHHRGQAHVQLHALGVAPPQLDEFHLRFDRAATAEAFGA
ncbi:nuclease [Roseobacter cerasinus]|uniref:Nuclease n=1 Tax=Roseobacter cerasinus TaxID=2602289 RepID=A0A640VS56_9RHOB|nr:DinB family protein [Roseobacter cerasinus]GFE49735.1 nuclease [Roseobacter cerasinus]